MKRRKWFAIGCLSVMLVVIGGTASAGAQDQQPQSYTRAEYGAYQTAHGQKDPLAKLKLLDDFVMKYPDSVLTPFIYQTYYGTYFSMQNFPKTVEYVDKYLSLADRFTAGSRLAALFTRAYAYYLGCGESVFHTPEAYAGVRDAAARGLQTLNQLQEPPTLTDEQFAAQKRGMQVMFSTVAGMADAGLRDLTVDPCRGAPMIEFGPQPSGPGSDPRVFDRMIERLKALDVQNPPVR